MWSPMAVLFMLNLAFRSASRKYPETAGNRIRAQAESMLELPEVPSNTPGVHV